MSKFLIITSEPENYVPIELKKSGEKHNIQVVIAVTENFSFTFLEDGKLEINYNDVENDIKLNVTDFDMCIPRLNDDNLSIKESLLYAIEDANVKIIEKERKEMSQIL
jgi:hypothetical protein